MYKRCESKMLYIVEHICWIFISMFFYRGIMFRKLDFTNYFISCLILDGLLVFFSIAGGIYDLHFQYCTCGIFYNLFLAYGVYTCITYYFVFKDFMMVVGVSVIALTVACLLALYYKYVISLRYEDYYAKRHVHLGIYACRRNFAYAMLLIVFMIGGRIIFTDSVAKDMESNVLGQYEDSTYRIEISIEHIMNSPAEKVLQTILHEAYHCYQEQCVKVYKKLSPEERNLMLFYHTARYYDEFNNYVNGSENIEGYWNQQVEIDAREYAQNGVKEYYRLIEEEGF